MENNGKEFNSELAETVNKVDLSNLKVGPNCLYALFKYAKGVRQINHIDLSNNMLRDAGLYGMKELIKAPGINSINLASNMITAIGLANVVDSILNAKSLVTINLGVHPGSCAYNLLGFEGG